LRAEAIVMGWLSLRAINIDKDGNKNPKPFAGCGKGFQNCG